ncbi:N-ethylammeline chlorohydrolase [Arsenicitalea aurantiaca]|uniref:N-ethylammeline chlorohydrolase n=1 Tax=Arsenicitalea aurantiaca TaxID=1783274 RepID=A0A433XBI4_9HYPH|nr:amidohydrolase family protein [Arsenicitalea aurantiaca]RUT31422.1 N-ethylammeline chlorohydrolase [Arsenicitalea aurantiaca]
MTKTICIRNAAWIIGWSEAQDDHVYLRDGDVAWTGDRLVQVGGRYEGTVDTEIDGRTRLVMPGLIDIHCHPTQTPIYRGFVEEFGDPRLFFNGRQDFRQSFVQDEPAMRASARYGLAEMAAAGITTIVDLSHAYPGWLDILDESGLRVWVAPMFRSARWWASTGQETRYDWSEDMGAAAFAEACEVMDAAESHPNGRFSAMVAPAQIDTCTTELLQQAIALAAETGRTLFTHGAQSYPEFNQMARLHDKSPVAYMDEIGFLGERTIIGHAVFTDEHPWLLWKTREDLDLLAKSGTTIAHCPTIFVRDGTLLHHIGAYMDAGVNVAIGTDTHPQNMLEEIRAAELLARAAAGPRHTSNTARLFRAATAGAAKVLGRDDIGRLAPGAKADLVTFDLDHPQMHPMRDPLRTIVHQAAERAIDNVYVDGEIVVAQGQPTRIDWREAAEALTREQARIAGKAGDIDAIIPLALAYGS